MPVSESQKRAQKKYMESHPRKRVPVDMVQEDYDKLLDVAREAGMLPVTYVKKAISQVSGQEFSWDKKQSPSEETE